MSRDLDTFQRFTHVHVAEFDASLSGIGILFYSVIDEVEQPVARIQEDITSLGFGVDASFQNTAEFIAGVLAGRGIKMLGWQNDPILYRGDSVSALTWIMKEGVRSDSASAAAVVFVLQSIAYGFNHVSTSHLSGEDNFLADSQSRGGSCSALGEAWTDRPALDTQPGEILELCRPGCRFASDEELWSFIERARVVIERF